MVKTPRALDEFEHPATAFKTLCTRVETIFFEALHQHLGSGFRVRISPSAFEIAGATPAPTEVLGLNARRVIAKRYSLKDAQANAIEEWPDIVRRVVGHVAGAETDIVKRDEFYQTMAGIMMRREFVPNTPCLVNAGKPGGQLAACFVLDVPDS